MKRVMLYFGSFNPIHKGHIALAEYAVEKGLCDELVLVVSPQSPYKQAEELAPEMDRFEMAEAACAASRYPDRVCAMIEFNKALSKKIYAGADMFLMPSKSEPCGLSQMIASRYGTVAIVRETGGLADTIIPYNEFENTGNGFSFVNYNAHDMMNTVYYARTVYGDGEKWRSIVRRAMDTDFSWHSSAGKYIDLYTSMQY